MKNRRSRFIAGCAIAFLLTSLAGCSSGHPADEKLRSERGYIYYLDGSGGGNAITNWSGGVRQGLRDAGYDGFGEMFVWETGLGVAADHGSSVSYKKERAAELAAKIVAFHRANPRTPITLMGLSAGNAVLIYTLEALPLEPIINDVVLLSSSVSADYNLTDALERVSGHCYVFTSQRDSVLLLLVPVGGTADRKAGNVATMGVEGAKMPAGASRDQYKKVIEIPWSPEFARLGHAGGHTDSVATGFVREVVAPLVMTTSTKAVADAKLQTGLVDNPDYARWARFAPGSTVTVRATQAVDGRKTPVTLKSTLISKTADRIVVDRVFSTDFGGDAGTPGPRRLFIPARIQPEEHPITNPNSKIAPVEKHEFHVRGKAIMAEGRKVESMGRSSAWGDDAKGTVYTCPDVPGGMLQIDIQTKYMGSALEFSGELVDYKVVQ